MSTGEENARRKLKGWEWTQKRLLYSPAEDTEAWVGWEIAALNTCSLSNPLTEDKTEERSLDMERSKCLAPR